MRLLILTQYFWPESFRINDLAIAMKERGHTVSVLTGLPNYPEGKFKPGYGYAGPYSEEYEGIPIKRVPLFPRGSNALSLMVNYGTFALTAALLGPLKLKQEYDAILVYQPSPIFIGLASATVKRYLGVPLLFWVQDIWPDTLSAVNAVHSPYWISMVDQITRWTYQRCDRVLMQSEGFRSRLSEQQVPNDKIIYLPNWAEDFYRPVEVEADAPERAELPKGFTVLFAGNIGKAQSFHTILDAAGKLRSHSHIQWAVLGDGKERAWLESEIKRRDLSACFRWLGSRPATAMPRYFACADALLVTLKNEPIFDMTIPAKVSSYLACGRPIIAALSGEGARVIRSANAGLVGAPEDSDALAENVLKLSALSEQERADMGIRGRQKYVEEFERNMVISRLEQTLLNTMKEAGCAYFS